MKEDAGITGLTGTNGELKADDEASINGPVEFDGPSADLAKNLVYELGASGGVY